MVELPYVYVTDQATYVKQYDNNPYARIRGMRWKHGSYRSQLNACDRDVRMIHANQDLCGVLGAVLAARQQLLQDSSSSPAGKS
jgi:hypothetical protein